jgi:hypothetical protein
VHAFINVAMDGDTPLSVGEPLGTNAVWLDRAHVKALFEKALRMETRADAAYYSEGSVAGRLHPGTIRTGDIYSLESWQENAEVVEIRGSNLAAPMRAYLKEQNIELDPAKMYKIATSPYAASDLQDHLGRIESRSTGALIRDLTIAHLKSNGFS